MATHDRAAFAAVSHLTIGGFRDWPLSDAATPAALLALTPETVAAASKLMRHRDLVAIARKCRVEVTSRTTPGGPGRLATRLQRNHPADSLTGIAAATLDGLRHLRRRRQPGHRGRRRRPCGAREAGRARERLDVPTRTCVLAHVADNARMIERGRPVGVALRSIAGTEAADRGFRVDLAVLREAREAALAPPRGPPGGRVMDLEPGQGSARAHHGLDQQTAKARAYAVARALRPPLVNTASGLIGPECLYDGKEDVRAGLDDRFRSELMGLRMGCDVRHANHAEVDQDDLDVLATLPGVAGATFPVAVPGADDVTLRHRSLSFHDVPQVRAALGLRPAPEFEARLGRTDARDAAGRIRPPSDRPAPGGARASPRRGARRAGHAGPSGGPNTPPRRARPQPSGRPDEVLAPPDRGRRLDPACLGALPAGPCDLAPSPPTGCP